MELSGRTLKLASVWHAINQTSRRVLARSHTQTPRGINEYDAADELEQPGRTLHRMMTIPARGAQPTNTHTHTYTHALAPDSILSLMKLPL